MRRCPLEILNESRLIPIAQLEADAGGRVQVELGIGDVHASAVRDGWYAETLCRGASEDGAVLALAPPEDPAQGWTEFTFRAPAPVPPVPLTGAQKQARARVRARGDRLRQKRLAGFYDPEQAGRCPGCEDLLREARGNFAQIHAFLTRDADPLREALLRALSAKDLRDAPAELLEHHLRRAAPWAGRFPQEVYVSALLNPRVALERLTDWSMPLPGAVGAVARLRGRGVPVPSAPAGRRGGDMAGGGLYALPGGADRTKPSSCAGPAKSRCTAGTGRSPAGRETAGRTCCFPTGSGRGRSCPRS